MRLDWASLLDLLRSTQRFVLTSHIRPDCDALGSELGLAAGLEAFSQIDGVERHVRIVNAQATPAISNVSIRPAHADPFGIAFGVEGAHLRGLRRR